MANVHDVYISKEVADELNLNQSYLIRLAKDLKAEGIIMENDMRLAGKRTYLFTRKAISEIQNKIK